MKLYILKYDEMANINYTKFRHFLVRNMIDIKYTLKIIYYQPIVNANAFKDIERTNKNFDKVFINPL